jgi:tRNA dimethylallyltransferase
MNSQQKQVIIVVGPTASGKTALAIELAKHFNTEIISADSRQCYKELKIGVARPSLEELSAVPHHFIASQSIEQELTAADFESFALQKTAELFKQMDKVLMVGGTGLYIKAFCEGFDAIPPVDPAIRNMIIDSYDLKGIAWLQQELKEKDPQFAVVGEMKNPQRMMRALEVFESTGISIIEFRKGKRSNRPFLTTLIGLEMPKEELRERIDKRVDRMMSDGLLEEVKALLRFRNANALKTVGYSELFDHLDGNISLEKAVQLIKVHTWQYAKRQMTWFKKNENIKWYLSSQVQEIIDHCKQATN